MWTYQGNPFDEIPEDIKSFVYIITNKTNNKKYVGKKTFTFAKTKQIKKKKKRFRVASDWQLYYGSNNQLKHDVELLGRENFDREILHLCKTKGTANYLEAHEILSRHAIVSEEYYNQWLSVKVSRSQIKL